MTIVSSTLIPCFPCRIANPSGYAMIGWVFPGKDTCPGGTAHLTGGISPGELHSFTGNAVNIGAFVKAGALIAEVPGTHVIHQNKQHIGTLRCKPIEKECIRKEKEYEIIHS